MNSTAGGSPSSNFLSEAES